MLPDCLFCKIVAGDVPARLIESDDDLVVFADIAPQAPTHLLAVTRRHFANMGEVDDPRLRAHLMATAALVGKEHGPNGYRLVVNTGVEGGQTVDHVHVHILAGRPMLWPPG